MPRRERIVVDLAPIQSKHELHEALREALNFPGWYGRNWDALWDAITALVEMPERLELRGWQGFEARLPREAHHLRSALNEMTTKYPNLASEAIYM